jgi:hypothetical protein
MRCERCGASDQQGPRCCGYCGVVLGVAARLAWDDPALAVSSDTSLRRPYRLLQNWYRERVLDADYGYMHTNAGSRPVGSRLGEWEVDAARALNFLGDPVVLDYVDKRVPVVVAAGGTLEEHRLRHNMLSSMPMAFTLVAALRGAEDRDEIVRQMFGVPLDGVLDVEAEWVPDRPRSELLADRSALDAVVVLSGPSSSKPVVGIETKYTEPLSEKEYFSDRLVEVTEACDWFSPGAAEHLRLRSTNQLWRESLLTWLGGGSESFFVVIGLRRDTKLWNSVERLQSYMARPDRVVARSWEEAIGSLGGTSLESLGLLFEERYLDTSPVETT